MINFKSVLSISKAESRVTRRLARYWIFLLFSYLLAFFMYIRNSVMHYFSSYTATAGLVSPKYLISISGLLFLIIYTVGVVFLAFDVRARDKRERMSEVLDSRPYTNLELVFGRFLGIFLPSWVPVIVLAILLQAFGYLLVGLGSPAGEPMEIYSVLTFVFLMSIPALAFTISIVFFFTLLVRNRLVAAVLLLIILGLIYTGNFMLPVYKAQVLDTMGILQGKFPSEITFDVMSISNFLQRIAVLLASMGILGLCAAVHPRLDDGSRSRTAIISIVIVAVSALVPLFMYKGHVNDMEQQDLWLQAHSAYVDTPVPDIQMISGKVNIDPGKSLDIDLEISFKSPGSGPIKNAVFTLNPGQSVESVLDESGKNLNFNHKDGVLDIVLDKPLAPGEKASIKLNIEGIPDINFCYLNSSVDSREIATLYANTALLGTENYIYNSDFVVLMPGVYWLPASGPETDRDNQRVRPVDYYNVDLYVSLPKNWLAAGPGKRNKVEEKESYNVFRFSPPSVVPEVALIASEFETRSFEVENVFMELLINKKHMKNIELLADTGEKIRFYISKVMKEAKEYGLSYPYDGLTLVEVPTTLRTFGGGWRLDSVQSPPGILLLKELSLPTSRFDSAFRNPERFKEREGGLPQAKLDRLLAFFKNDLSGGNVLTGATRNFFMHQTSAVGPESLALNFLMETLTGQILADSKAYFSAHIFSSDRINSVTNNTLISYQQLSGIGETISNSAIRAVTSRPEIWEIALEESLKDLDPWKEPEDTLDVLTLKGHAISDSIYKILGREKTAELLSIIRNNHRGGSFTVDDMIAAGKSLGYDLEALFGDWIGGTDLPGFIVSSADAYRLPDDENGNPRYQLLFTIRNDETEPGVFRIIYYYPADNNNRFELPESEPVRLEGKKAIQYGSVVSRLPSMYFLNPYLSLNRKIFNIKVGSVDHNKIVNKEPVEGVREIPWETPNAGSIIVDDLDDDFSVALDEQEEGGFRLRSFINPEVEKDQGLYRIPLNNLPRGTRIPGEWARMSAGSAYGKYRHTTALIRPGEGNEKALFSSSLPDKGAWDLEFYLPMKDVFPGKSWGTYHLNVKDSNGDQHKLEFDSKAGNEGWNMVEKLDLPQGTITVELSDETDGDIVIADAIRWTPSAGN
ncbi:hypothetical protein ACFL1N_08965 [Thermodesulfobacteriota bacterium]